MLCRVLRVWAVCCWQAICPLGQHRLRRVAGDNGMVSMPVLEELAIGGKDCEAGLVVSSRSRVRVASVEAC